MESPNALYYLALAGFIPAVALCMSSLDPLRAVLVSLLGGWLLLPHFDAYGSAVPILHTKAMLVPVVVAAASAVRDLPSWRRLRPSAVDLPVAAYCVAQLAASLANDQGPYDAVSALLQAGSIWLAPYLLGRVYLGDGKGMRAWADAMVVAALAYVPLALWEIRMSPQLHRTVYGYIQHGFIQHIRAGGFRPLLFMEHGLMVALFFACAALVAYWQWRTRARRDLLGIPLAAVWPALALTTVLCKSIGPLALLAVGIAVLEGTRRWRTSVLVIALVALPAAYGSARLLGWSGRSLVSVAREHVNPERAQSLEFRMHNEDLLVAKALQRPWLGWSRWGRSRVYDESGRDISVTDGMWVIVLGVSGLVGLASLAIALALPCLLAIRRFPGRLWGNPAIAPLAATAVSLALWAIDGQLNAMMTPLFPAMAGGLASVWLRSAGGARAARPRALERAPGSAVELAGHGAP